jgi:uncharacterized OB-fold protein
LRDYVLCSECGRINWYENDECINCKSNLKLSIDDEDKIEEYIKNEYKEYAGLGYSEEEIDGIYLEV